MGKIEAGMVFPDFGVEEGESMKDQDFLCGMAMGAMVGAVMGAALAPRRKSQVKKAADKAMRTVGEVMENLSEEMGLR